MSVEEKNLIPPSIPTERDWDPTAMEKFNLMKEITKTEKSKNKFARNNYGKLPKLSFQ